MFVLFLYEFVQQRDIWWYVPVFHESLYTGDGFSIGNGISNLGGHILVLCERRVTSLFRDSLLQVNCRACLFPQDNSSDRAGRANLKNSDKSDF